MAEESAVSFILRYRVRLRLTEPVRFQFQHAGVLRGLVSRALGRHDLPVGLIPNAPESGQVEYAAGDAYHLGVTLVGDARALASRLVEGLVRLGMGERHESGQRPPTLGGNFRVEGVDPVELPDLDDLVQSLAGRPSVTLRFLSPLRLRRPDELVEKRAAYLNGDCFPPAHFLDSLERRLLRLAGEGGGRAGDGGPSPPPVRMDLRRIRAEPGELPWVDVPVPGSPSKGRAYTLGGVLGRVVLRDVPDRVLPLLVVGSHLHVGSSTGYGLGRYRIEELEWRDPLERPAKTLLERAATVQRVVEAMRAEKCEGQPAGRGDVSATAAPGGNGEAEGIAGDPIALVRDLASGAWPTVAGCGGERGAVPAGPGSSCCCPACARSRVAQRAVASVLRPAVEAYLENASWAYRGGYSRAGARRAWRRREGFRVVEDGQAVLAAAGLPETVAELLEALFVDEPLVDAVRGWLEAGEVLPGGPLWRVLLLVVLEEVDRRLGGEVRTVRHGDEVVVVEALAREVRGAL